MNQFPDYIIEAVWQKAYIQPNNDPNVFRKDYAGAWIKRSDYGNRKSKYGWEIDHLKPKYLGGSDDINNLYPLYWENNLSKGDDYPNWQTEYASDGINNVKQTKGWRV